ncbi:Fes1p [Malassezia vespertilionis]|uniref:Fes1p n=2 Tax=Malassezia vespertilionis TaxID=2020962 RepID=A0A2N1JDA7_9BASI|nr:Fes1p [Malassezia vespertilionis]
MTDNKNANELLQWGLRNAPARPDGSSSVAEVSEAIAQGRRPDLADPGLFDALMGKSEAQMMREELAVGSDTRRSVEDRTTALDNFEMLIETVDNANNMQNMNMWPAVVHLLQEPTPAIQQASAWIVGTAVQNNDKGQVAALEHGALARLLELLSSPSKDVRNKAMYGIGAMIKNFPYAALQFSELHGWDALHAGLLDSSIAVRSKVAFLLNQLLSEDASHAVPNTHSAPPTSDAHAPLEKGPATLQFSAPAPDVAKAMVDHRILDTLLASVLPNATQAAATCDGEPTRSYLDYAGKAVQTLVTYSAHAPVPREAFQALLAELDAAPSA